jgi:hypothetical protein
MNHPRPLHWRWVKSQREQVAGWQCEWLGCAEPSVDGHHTTYENYGDERPDEIRLLCRRHHDSAHYDLGPAPEQLCLDDYYLSAAQPYRERAMWTHFASVGHDVRVLIADLLAA